MNIKIVDSWLREYLDTDAKPQEIAEKLSLTSVSVEKVSKIANDFVYDIEVTSNRPDLMSVTGIAREAAAILPQFKIRAKFLENKAFKLKESNKSTPIEIKNNPKLVNRIMSAIIDIEVKQSPQLIKERLELSGIRSLNNLIDITNYVMRETGHPAHVFDFERLNTKKLIIRESKKGEKITTLDNKEHKLFGNDIIAENDKGEIVDLLGIMGTANSVINDNTKQIMYFLDNNEPVRIRRTSMALGIRSEAAIINEKGVDPELMEIAFLKGIELYEKYADGKLEYKTIDIYPNKPKTETVTVNKVKIDQVIGVEIPLSESSDILSGLGFKTKINGNNLIVSVPNFRANDIKIPEDVIEEIARIYGYFKLPSVLPPLRDTDFYHMEKDEFYWTKKVKDAFKYYGFTETYTYSMVSKDMLEGPENEAVALSNPLTEDMTYLRLTLIPSLLNVVRRNKNREDLKIFEIANIYRARKSDLPEELLSLAGIVKRSNVSFYEVKGLLEQIFTDLGIKKINFKPTEKGGLGAAVFAGNSYFGEMELLDETTVNFEVNFLELLKHVSLKKTYKPLSKHPPVLEDLAFIVPENLSTGDILEFIKNIDILISDVSLLDTYSDTRTFHLVYQNPDGNLNSDEILKIRNKITSSLKKKFSVNLKS